MDERDYQIIKLQDALDREARKSADLRIAILDLSKRLDATTKLLNEATK